MKLTSYSHTAGRQRTRHLLGGRLSLGLSVAVLGCGLLLGLAIQDAQAASEYERIREKAEELAIAVNKANMEPLAEGKNSSLESTYGGFGYLLTPSKLTKLGELVNEATDPAEKALRQETADMIRYHAIRAQVAPVIDNCINSMRDNTTVVEGNTVRLRGLAHQIGLEEDRDARRGAWLATSQLYTAINVYRRSLLMDLNERSTELGYEGYHAFLQEVQGWDLGLMKSAAETVLAGTTDQYTELLSSWADRELQLEVRKLRSYDAMRLFFFPSLGEKVGKFKPVELAEDALEQMGIQLKKQRLLKIESKKKDGRIPQASAFPVQVGKCEVTMIPSEQVSDLQDLLGAIGEAQFHYQISNDVRFEDAYFGTNVYPAAYGALLQLLVEEQAWIEENVKLKGATAEEVAEAFRLRRLYQLRETAGHYLFQLQLQENPRIDAEVYNTVMEGALGWKHTRNDADAYLMSNDDYASGGRLLGYAIAVQIRAQLRAENGEKWWKSKSVGEKLAQGASGGFGLGLDEFLGVFGIASLDPSVLVAER